jgi:hypothetical protein
MSNFLRRREPIILITLICGVVVFSNYFTPVTGGASKGINTWVTVLASFSAILGSLTTLMSNAGRIRRQAEGWPLAIVLIASFAITAFIGLAYGTSSSGYLYIQIQLLAPLFAAVYSIVFVYTLSGGYRGFRVVNLETLVMFISVAIIFLQNAPIGVYYMPWLNPIANWIYDVPSLSALRGLRWVMAVGGIFMAFRILSGRGRGGAGNGGGGE